MNNVPKAWVYDSGIWADRTGELSGPRLLAALRAVEESGIVKIHGLSHPRPDTPILTLIEEEKRSQEPEEAYTHRKEKTHNVRKERVKQTADILGYSSDINKAKKCQIIFLVMPCSQQRNTVISELVQRHSEARIVIHPPGFKSEKELNELLEQVDPCATRLRPFLPYRYSSGIKAVRAAQKQENERLQVGSLNVISGPYPAVSLEIIRTFLIEFCLPALDTLIYLSGPVSEGRVIHKKAGGLLPLIVGNFTHKEPDKDSEVLSSLILSTTGNFKEINFDAKFFFEGSTIELRDAFQNTVSRAGPRGNTFSEVGHDPSGWELNGYREMLKRLIEDEESVPTFQDFLLTQRLVDILFSAFKGSPEGTPVIADIPGKGKKNEKRTKESGRKIQG